mmetsp:Transcript_39323/g.116518  ORF Transcript_39323/g.116518 Transcript_39323/m.116518 type:complete len:279 (-) Transcript_39323:579-1415(-)
MASAISSSVDPFLPLYFAFSFASSKAFSKALIAPRSSFSISRHLSICFFRSAICAAWSLSCFLSSSSSRSFASSSAELSTIFVSPFTTVGLGGGWFLSFSSMALRAASSSSKALTRSCSFLSLSIISSISFLCFASRALYAAVVGRSGSSTSMPASCAFRPCTSALISSSSARSLSAASRSSCSCFSRAALSASACFLAFLSFSSSALSFSMSLSRALISFFSLLIMAAPLSDSAASSCFSSAAPSLSANADPSFTRSSMTSRTNFLVVSSSTNSRGS